MGGNYLSIHVHVREGEKKIMKKKQTDKYWENEEGELVEFGKYFMRCFDKAGKLQFGTIYINKNTQEKGYLVKFTLDRKELLNSDEGASYLKQTIEDWENEFDE